MTQVSLSDLEARYDGTIPKHLRDAAMDGPARGSRDASESAWRRVRFWHRRCRQARNPKDAYWSRHWFLIAVATWAKCRAEESAAVGNSVGALGWQTLSDVAKRRASEPENPTPQRRAA